MLSTVKSLRNNDSDGWSVDDNGGGGGGGLECLNSMDNWKLLFSL